MTSLLRALRVSRRQFIVSSAAAVTGAMLAPSEVLSTQPPLRVGFIGLGARGSGHLAEWLSTPGVQVSAICDRDDAALDTACSMFDGCTRPAIVTNEPSRFFGQALDAVCISTPLVSRAAFVESALANNTPVYIDFPWAGTLEESSRILEAVNRTGLLVFQAARDSAWDAEAIAAALTMPGAARPALVEMIVAKAPADLAGDSVLDLVDAADLASCLLSAAAPEAATLLRFDAAVTSGTPLSISRAAYATGASALQLCSDSSLAVGDCAVHVRTFSAEASREALIRSVPLGATHNSPSLSWERFRLTLSLGALGAAKEAARAHGLVTWSAMVSQS
jgi:hypothetical protein